MHIVNYAAPGWVVLDGLSLAMETSRGRGTMVVPAVHHLVHGRRPAEDAGYAPRWRADVHPTRGRDGRPDASGRPRIIPRSGIDAGGGSGATAAAQSPRRILRCTRSGRPERRPVPPMGPPPTAGDRCSASWAACSTGSTELRRTGPLPTGPIGHPPRLGSFCQHEDAAFHDRLARAFTRQYPQRG
jgi:hypothetical protein